MLLRALTITLALTGAATAQEPPEGLAESIAEIASGCWPVFPSERTPEYAVNLEVILGPNGEVIGAPTVLDHRDSVKFGPVRRSARIAISQCGPYPEAEGFEGVVKITMTPRSQ